eukprot:TRINITY_DN8071_c0_g3_i1.p1 TRINITY_DN8071_c0_g3~~TRINITY_DN8071_c0_g3_i1.p1  ORF type:complete len:143 (+),score=22.94 TRINITY_DN8071_c0_g3_i1:71-499(+)
MILLRRVLRTLADKLATTKYGSAALSSENVPCEINKMWLRIQEIDADDISPNDSISNADCEEDWRASVDIDDIHPEDSCSNVEKPTFDPAAKQNTLSTEDQDPKSSAVEGINSDLDGSRHFAVATRRMTGSMAHGTLAIMCG